MILLVLFIAPMWINFTLRVVALKEVLTMVEGNLGISSVFEYGAWYDL